MEKIIRILSISDKWMTKKELAKRIGSSESTFVRYIEEIKIRWGTDVTIQSSQKLGYRLEHLNVPAYLNVLMEMSQSSTNSRLLNEIIVNPGKTIEYYCEKISISRSSFTRKLKQCNQILESYLLKVIVDQGFQLTSLKSELQLRIFVTFFFLSYYGRRTLPFPIEKKKIKEIMVKNNCQMNLFQEESPYEQSFFIMYFVVHLMRESQGTPFEWKAGDSYVQLINIDKKDFLILKNLLGKLKYSSYIKVVNYFVNTIFSEFSEKEKNEEYVVQLLTQIYFFSRIFPYDTTHLTIRATYFAQQMQHRQIRLYAGFRAELQFYSTLLNQNLIYYLSSYIFWMLIGNPEIHHYTSDKKILIISDLSLRHSQYIEEYISDILAVHKIHSETTAITEDQLSKYNLLEYDLIVTNQPILNAHVPHILIDDSVSFANEEELIRLFEL
ncbi:TPA: HTH domain-containing protein [Enterococcus faecium]|nr:HTH domain-containing protein [Enterococcus faecium]HAP6200635.1 HTH domain-containing protein [Enterococcus faecium]HAP6238596.1 HTH domain-containing protein [Enterococcus faecium]HAQ8187867.1 HTH domain-containing protein [Enterococcus faecium]HAQ8243005.1 HTH domain-containing protein [Enterococcus faecium]